MIVNNTLSKIGDVLVISTDGPVTDIDNILSFTDSVSGETGTRFFDKTFRYTTDGVNWSEWMELSAFNLQNILIDDSYDFDIEYQYTRAGTDDTGLLEWHWTNLEMSSVSNVVPDVFVNSIFYKFYKQLCDREVLNWSVNVLGKVYEPGIVSKSLIRGLQGNVNEEDRDYIDFWRAITCYFGLFVGYARKFENLNEIDFLLEEYLLSRGLYVGNNESIEDLQELMSTFYKQIRERGTKSMSQIDVNGQQGELMRLISFNPLTDEHILGITDERSSGWTMDTRSPLHKDVMNQESVRKQYDIVEGKTASELYPLLNSGSCSMITEGDDYVLRLSPVAADKTGIGASTITADLRTNVDPNLPYQIRFFAKADDLSAKITLRVLGFDSSGAAADPQTVELIPVSIVSMNKVQLIKVDEYYLVRAIIYPHNHIYVADDEIIKTSLSDGVNLKFDPDTTSVFIEVTLDNTSSDCTGDLYIKDYSFQLLRTDYGKGFVGASSIVETWIKNNSGRYSNEEINAIMRDYLIPYQSGMINNFI